MLAQGLAHDIEPARQRGIAEGPFCCVRPIRPLGADPMADGLFGVLRHQRFQLGFGALMLQKGLSGAAEYTGKLPPGVRGAHIHDPDGFDSWLWWFDAKEARGLAAFDTTPEF